jgi:starvation-inducible outer membrane lipoprotein
VIALSLIVAACSTAPKNYAGTDPQMSVGRDTKYCLKRPDILECRQNGGDY